MKLAYLISRYPAYSHTFIKREIQQLREMGFSIDVASINTPDIPAGKRTSLEEKEASNTFYVKREGFWGALSALFKTIVRYPAGFFRGLCYSFYLAGFDFKRLLYHFFYFIEASIIGFWMRKLSVTHLHVHFANPASTVGLILSKIFPFTFSMTVHGPDEFYDATLNSLKEKIEGSAFICCIGYYAQSQLMKLSSVKDWTKFEICPLGVDPALFLPRPSQQSSARVNILCVGRLVPSKGQHILVQVMKSLVQQSHDVHLCLVGEGPDRDSLEKEVRDLGLNEHIVFTGAINENEIKTAYLKADLFVLPSFAEGIPVSLMEAMAMEIPCISTYINGIPEMIRHGIDGWLVVPSDVTALTQAMQDLITQPEMRQRLGKAGRMRILEKYQLVPNTKHLGEIFQKRLR